MLALALGIQSALIVTWPAAVRPRAASSRSSRAWRPSLFAGFMGALASQFWFMAFALANAASVRTLALVEVLFAQVVTRGCSSSARACAKSSGMALHAVRRRAAAAGRETR